MMNTVHIAVHDKGELMLLRRGSVQVRLQKEEKKMETEHYKGEREKNGHSEG